MDEEGIYTLVQWIYVVLTLLLVVNRLYIRALGRSQFFSNTAASWSDILVVLAWVFFLFQNVCDTLIYASGGAEYLYMDSQDLSPEDLKKFVIISKISFVEYEIYYIPLYAVKGAILTFFLEVTNVSLGLLRRAIWLGLLFCVVGIFATTLVYLTFCPITHWWHPERWIPSCDIGNNVIRGFLYFHIFTDCYIYIILFFIIRRLKFTTWPQRAAAAVMFVLGFLEICIGVPQISLDDSIGGDDLWTFWFGLHEQTLAIVIACLPQLRMSVIRALSRRRRRGHRSLQVRLRRGELSTKEVAKDCAIQKDSSGHDSKAEEVSRLEPTYSNLHRGEKDSSTYNIRDLETV